MNEKKYCDSCGGRIGGHYYNDPKPCNCVYYSEAALVSFGGYLLSEQRDKIISDSNKRNVTHADLENWKHFLKNIKNQ